MKNLSRWAKTHPKTAISLIVIGHFLVVLNAICSGVLLYLFDWGTSTFLLNAAVLVFCISYLLYPKKGNKTGLFRYSYIRQKIQDFALVFSYGLIIALGVNNFFTQEDAVALRQPVAKFMSLRSVPENEIKVTPEKTRFSKSKIREMKKQLRHELKALKKEFKKQGNKNGGGASKVILIILVIGFATLLGYLIAIIACNLACSGQEGLGALVLFGGGAALIVLFFIALTKIIDTPKEAFEQPDS